MLKRLILKSCLVLSVLFLMLLVGCARNQKLNQNMTQTNTQSQIPDLLDVSESDNDEQETSRIFDPFKPINEITLSINKEVIYDLGLSPASDVYDFVTPDLVQTGIGNFFHNLKFPVRLVEDIATFDFEALGKDTLFFTVNSIGLWFIDLRSTQDRSDRGDGNFSKALAYWGIPPGPYIVWPLIGPSNLRDSLGMIVNLSLTPTTYLGSPDSFILGAINTINTYQNRDEPLIKDVYKFTVNPYEAFKNIYYDISEKRLAK